MTRKTKKQADEATTEATTQTAEQRRISIYADKPLFKTNEGERIRRVPTSRRTITYNLIQDGMTFQQVVDAGGHAGDLLNLLRWKNVMTTPECDTSGAENGRYARAFPDSTPAPKPAAKTKRTKKAAKK